MVGHTHEDIDSFFSTIAAKLKSGIVCPDFQSMVAAIQSAFDEPFDKPLVTFFNAIDIFDYTKLYEPVIDSTIAYHQHPHQFCIKRFDENTAVYFTTSNGRTANSGYLCQQIFHLKWWHNQHICIYNQSTSKPSKQFAFIANKVTEKEKATKNDSLDNYLWAAIIHNTRACHRQTNCECSYS